MSIDFWYGVYFGIMLCASGIVLYAIVQYGSNHRKN